MRIIMVLGTTLVLIVLLFPAQANAGQMMTCAKLEKMSMKMMQKACKSHMGLSCCRQENAHLGGYAGTASVHVAAPAAQVSQRLRTVRTRPRMLSRQENAHFNSK